GFELRARHYVRPGRTRPAFKYSRKRQHASHHRDDRLGKPGTRGGSDAPRRERFHPETVGKRAAARHPKDPDRTVAGVAKKPAARSRKSAVACRWTAGDDRRIRGHASGDGFNR